MPHIVCIGEALVEIMRTERDRPLAAPAHFAGPYPSGAPAIFASAAARLGSSVGFVGTVGHDAFGDCILERLNADRVDCVAVRRTTDRLTGIAFVSYRSDGTRSFLFHMAQSAAALVDKGQIPDGYLAETRHLHVMGSSLAVNERMRDTCYWAAETVKAQGGSVSLDPNLRPELMPLEQIRSVCTPILDVADFVFPSGAEATMLTGTATADAAANALIAGGARVVAIKQGEHGSDVYTQAGALHVPPYNITEVDPTGAGDCFDAAFVVGLLGDRATQDAASFANAVGALATTRLGPMEGAFPEKHVREFMAGRAETGEPDSPANQPPPEAVPPLPK